MTSRQVPPTIMLLRIIILVFLLVWILFPVYYLLLTSVKPDKELFDMPPKLLASPEFERYYDMLIARSFYRFFVNSIMICVSSTCLALALGSLATFAFTNWRFRGKEPLFFLTLVGKMFPPFTTLIPIYLMIKNMGLMDNHFALILIYAAFHIPMVLLVLREFFSGVPRELAECAMIDGCTPLQIFWRIVIPLSVNGLVAAGVLCFVEGWNEFLFGFLLTSINAKTASAALGTFKEGEGMVQWGQMSVLGMGTILPTILFMVFFQRFLIKGMTLGAVKG